MPLSIFLTLSEPEMIKIRMYIPDVSAMVTINPSIPLSRDRELTLLMTFTKMHETMIARSGLNTRVNTKGFSFVTIRSLVILRAALISSVK